MKIVDIPIWLTTWMSRLDRVVSLGRCYTNPFLATFLLYVFLVMGGMRATSVATEAIESLDNVYELMNQQDKGMGVMCLLFCVAETIMLCNGVADILTRFVLIVVLANILYMMGLFLPVLGQVLLGIIAFSYIYIFMLFVREGIRRLRGDSTYSRSSAEF